MPPVANLVRLELNSQTQQSSETRVQGQQRELPCREEGVRRDTSTQAGFEPAQEKLKKLCSGFELQIVKCKELHQKLQLAQLPGHLREMLVLLNSSLFGPQADTDPVRNLCKGTEVNLHGTLLAPSLSLVLNTGRAKVMVRYNPGRDGAAAGLPRFLCALLLAALSEGSQSSVKKCREFPVI